MPRIFISYRRADSAAIADRIYEKLARTFFYRNIFKDVDNIHVGGDIRARIETAIIQSDVVLVIIGKDWVNEFGKQRDIDYVLLEIEMAMRHGKLIIPVRVNDAPLPSRDQLPAGIRPLLSISMAEVRNDPYFKQDMKWLIKQICGGRCLFSPFRTGIVVGTTVIAVVLIIMWLVRIDFPTWFSSTPTPTYLIIGLVPSETPVPAETASFTPSATNTLSPTVTEVLTINTSTVTAAATLPTTALPTSTPSATPSITPTSTDTPTATLSTTSAPTLTPSFTPSVTPSMTPTSTDTSTATHTPTFTSTNTSTFTPTPTSSGTDTPTIMRTPMPTSTLNTTTTYTPNATLSPEQAAYEIASSRSTALATCTANCNALWQPIVMTIQGNHPHEMALIPASSGRASYWINRTEVSVDDYADCVAHGACSTLTQAGWTTPDFPVTYITPMQGNDYCAWALDSIDARLPTADEWVFAGGGPDHTTYAWGNDLSLATQAAHYAENNRSDQLMPLPVNREPGPLEVNWAGLIDMSGNIREWAGEGQFDWGSYGGDFESGSNRLALEPSPSGTTADTSYGNTGFRCVLPARGG